MLTMSSLETIWNGWNEFFQRLNVVSQPNFDAQPSVSKHCGELEKLPEQLSVKYRQYSVMWTSYLGENLQVS